MSQNPRRTDPDFISRLWNSLSLSIRLMLDQRVNIISKLIPVAVIAYILSPIDLIPDFLLPFGLVDDLSVFLLGLQLFIRSVPPDVVEEYRKGKKKQKVIEGDYQVKGE